MKSPAIDYMCYFVDMINEFLKELSLETPPMVELVVPPTLTTKVKEDEAKIYLEKGLEKCLALTLDPIPDSEKLKVELKELSQNLRYEFLDSELNRPAIVNSNLGKDKIEKLFFALKTYPEAIGKLTAYSGKTCYLTMS